MSKDQLSVWPQPDEAPRAGGAEEDAQLIEALATRVAARLGGRGAACLGPDTVRAWLTIAETLTRREVARASRRPRLRPVARD